MLEVMSIGQGDTYTHPYPDWKANHSPLTTHHSLLITHLPLATLGRQSSLSRTAQRAALMSRSSWVALSSTPHLSSLPGPSTTCEPQASTWVQNRPVSRSPSSTYSLYLPLSTRPRKSHPSCDLLWLLKTKGVTRPGSACARKPVRPAPTPVASTTTCRADH